MRAARASEELPMPLDRTQARIGPALSSRGRCLLALLGCIVVVIGTHGAVAQSPAHGGAASTPIVAAPQDAMLVYGADRARRERAIEQRFDALLNPTELGAWLKSMSSAPNQVGSPHDKANAEFMLQQLRGW